MNRRIADCPGFCSGSNSTMSQCLLSERSVFIAFQFNNRLCFKYKNHHGELFPLTTHHWATPLFNGSKGYILGSQCYKCLAVSPAEAAVVSVMPLSPALPPATITGCPFHHANQVLLMEVTKNSILLNPVDILQFLSSVSAADDTADQSHHEVRSSYNFCDHRFLVFCLWLWTLQSFLRAPLYLPSPLCSFRLCPGSPSLPIPHTSWAISSVTYLPISYVLTFSKVMSPVKISFLSIRNQAIYWAPFRCHPGPSISTCTNWRLSPSPPCPLGLTLLLATPAPSFLYGPNYSVRVPAMWLPGQKSQKPSLMSSSIAEQILSDLPSQ